MIREYSIINRPLKLNRFWIIDNSPDSPFRVDSWNYYDRALLLIISLMVMFFQISIITSTPHIILRILSILALLILIIIMIIISSDIALIREVFKIKRENSSSRALLVIDSKVVDSRKVLELIRLFDENIISDSFIYAIRMRFPFLYPTTLVLEEILFIIILSGILLTQQFWNPLLYLMIIIIYYLSREIIIFIISAIRYHLYLRS